MLTSPFWWQEKEYNKYLLFWSLDTVSLALKEAKLFEIIWTKPKQTQYGYLAIWGASTCITLQELKLNQPIMYIKRSSVWSEFAISVWHLCWVATVGNLQLWKVSEAARPGFIQFRMPLHPFMALSADFAALEWSCKWTGFTKIDIFFYLTFECFHLKIIVTKFFSIHLFYYFMSPKINSILQTWV